MSIQPSELIKNFEEYVCPICNGGIAIGGFTTWFRVRPESAQALNKIAGDKSLYENKIREEVAKRGYQFTWSSNGLTHPLNVSDPYSVHGRGMKIRDVCVGLFFGLSPSCKDKDVDNMTKAFLDAIKGPEGLISDDSAVTHLEVIKRELEHDLSSSQDNYLVGVRISLVSSKVGRSFPFSWNPAVPVI